MKLSEVLLDTDTLLPNAIVVTTKIRWINQLRRQLYRELPIPNAVYAFETEPGNQFYELPNDCPLDTVDAVVIGSKSYPKVNQSDRNPPGHFWTIVSGGFMISPAPKEIESGWIYYLPTPPDLTAADMDNELDFSQDYHQIFVDGCVTMVAKAQGDFKAVAVYEDAVQLMIQKMKRDMSRNDTYTIQMGDW